MVAFIVLFSAIKQMVCNSVACMMNLLLNKVKAKQQMATSN